MYQSTDPASGGFCWRVDDNYTTYCRVRGYESMSDVDTGTGPFPTDAQLSGGGYWACSENNATAKGYVLAADSMALLAPFAYSATYKSAVLRGFGEASPFNPADGYCAFISSAGSASDYSNYAGLETVVNGGSPGKLYMARALSGFGSAVAPANKPYTGGTGLTGADPYLGYFPSAVDGGLKLSRRFFGEYVAGGNIPPRADVPGVATIPQAGVYPTINRLDVVTPASGELSGRRLLAITDANSMVATITGVYFIDTTGPWR